MVLYATVRTNGHPAVAKQLRRFAMSPVSRPLIQPFVNMYDLQMQEADQPLESYKTLHDLFVRNLNETVRPIDRSAQAVVSPCDGVLSVVEDLTEDSRFYRQRDKTYSVSELLGSHHEAQNYIGWACLDLLSRVRKIITGFMYRLTEHPDKLYART